MSPSEILARAIGLPALPEPPVALPEPDVCAIGNCGRAITAGYERRKLTGDATGEFLDCFHGNVHGYLCEACARCFKGNNPHGGNQMARAHWAWADGTYWAPLINRESAREQGRPCWSDLAREAWPTRRGQECVIILTTDTHKRLWPGARSGAFGERTPVLFYDFGSAAAATLFLDWPRLLHSLAVIEDVYAAGWTKASIRTTLFSQFSLAHSCGLRKARHCERLLQSLRIEPEFLPALLMSQRPEGYVAPKSAPARSPRAVKTAQTSLF